MTVNPQQNQNQNNATKKPLRPDEYRPGDLPNEPYRDVPRAAEKQGNEHSKDKKSSGMDSDKKKGGKDSGCGC